MIFCGVILIASPEQKAEDKISHYMFRLAFCKTEEQRQWFLKNEAKLFVKRLIRDSKDATGAILDELKSYGSRPEMVRVEREVGAWKDLTACLPDLKAEDHVTFYKVPFETVCNLMPSRKYFLQRGYMFLPEAELPICIQVVFRDRLAEALNYATSKEAEIATDPRVARLLTRIRGWQSNGRYSAWKGKLEGKINLADIDMLAKRFYPPCAKILHNALKTNNHLKHDGRMQYGLFLKGMGLTLDDSVNFWRTEFTKKITTEVFQKRYLYNIRHNYGSEGKRADYTPWSCTKILNLPPPAEGQYHGCPFKTFSSDRILPLLRQYGVSDATLSIIMRAKETFQYELACLKLFEELNPGTGNAGSSPHAFFVETFNAHRNKAKHQQQAKEGQAVPEAKKGGDIEDMAN